MGRVAIVTGASRGIGAATAKLLGAQGYGVAVTYHSQRDKAQQVADAIVNAGGKAIALQADMGKEADIIAMFSAVSRELGPVNALVNNAGINPAGAVDEMAWDTVESLFRVNTFGVFLACREALAHMRRTGGGAIVNLSSEAARFGGNKMAHYAASKAAVNTFTIAFAREAAAHHIRVNAVSPGIVDTDMHNGISTERLAALRASLPMGRMGSADEAAQTIAWLLSDAASYISGAIIPVTGGR